MTEELTHVTLAEVHPMDELLRQDRLPHIWCAGCGLGTALTCFVSALGKSGLDPDKVATYAEYYATKVKGTEFSQPWMTPDYMMMQYRRYFGV